jgi:hypothetical protein
MRSTFFLVRSNRSVSRFGVDLTSPERSAKLGKPLFAKRRRFNPQFAPKGGTANYVPTTRRENILLVQTFERRVFTGCDGLVQAGDTKVVWHHIIQLTTL